ncbi:ubiquinone/menaquinone biosynthesis C-methylase UbiE [Kitasatospora sp. MAA19]|uniref:methyltransferase domain-containing protein n=1 Tax=unclassified Kitasatospora TaxID=2633591 RepID=UPI002476BB1F|nr:methyltransferase domain-containing protein [Kitasatospora sp. MAA19]MDH6707210.1 ubiquinone/menaquinone biosynthesis C-methylase UbiE [Kitasatospora sp. MAA19]
MTVGPSGANSDVANFYNGSGKVRVAGKIRDRWGGNLHNGYWHDDDDDAPPEVATDRLTDLMIERLAPQPGQRVLDIGCGIGKPATRLLRTHPVDVVGITISESQVAQARAGVSEAGLADRATFEYADAQRMPFPDDSFDAAWALESLFHVPDRDRALAETARVLRPKSRFVIADFVLRTPISEEGLQAVQRICETFGVHTVGPLDDYLAQLSSHGFTGFDVLDISDNVARTGNLLADAWEDVREQLVEDGNSDKVDALITATRDFSNTPEFGYVLVCATLG